ncbi:dockerin type I repeat-containing protein [Ruminococcus flavefaciens]|uniref:dockerin type I repeat-containing protein n=1 Tax=Ruminococcus flavefaciens TaxID=1265 RepID=UPI0026EA9309|nr:dockerin type I repeat-containing protein [Ruminococcus flavefaciens]
MKKMINILLTASMLISCIAVPLAASAAEPQTAIVQENIAEENIKISEKLKEDIDAGLEKIDVMMWCTFKIDYSKIFPEVNKATQEYAETLDTSVYSADEINEMVGAFKINLSDKMYQEAYAVKTKEVCDFIGIDISEADFTGTALRCSLTPEQIYKIADTDLIKGEVIKQTEFISGEDLGYHQVEVTDNKNEEAEKAKELFSKYIKENELDAKVVGQETYPDYSQPVIIEYNTSNVQNGLLIEFAEKNNIDRSIFTFVPIVNGMPMTTANPNGNKTTTTTTTTVVQEAQSLFNKYFEENKMDAKCVTSENYPSNYPPLVIEYATESDTITGPMIVEFAENNKIDRSLFTVAPTVNGVPMVAQDVETNVKGDANCDRQVDMSDVVLIMQALANPNKYGENGTAEVHLTAQGKENADMDGNGLTVGDAQAIQTMLLGIE